MSKLKKITAVLSAAMVSATLFGCADTSYIMKADGEEVKTGVYINYAVTELQSQIQTLMQSGTTADYLNQKVDGKNMTDYIADYAMKNTKELVAINKQFDEMGLKLDETVVKNINSQVNESWTANQKDFEKQGVGKESLKNVARGAEKKEAVFHAIYDEGGTEAVSEDELVKYVNENYLRYKVLTIAKSTASSTDESSEADESKTDDESKELYTKYLKEAKKLDFASFDKVIDEYNAYIQAQQAAESEAAVDDSLTLTEDGAIDLTGGEASEVEADSFEAEGDDESVAEVTEADETTDDTDESTDAADTESSSEVDSYPNENMTDYNDITDDQKEETVAKVLGEIKDKLKVDQVSSYEDDNAYYIYVKGDITERSKEFVADETNHHTLLETLKGDEFQSKLDEWVKKIKFDVNKEALDEFNAKNLYNKMNEKDD